MPNWQSAQCKVVVYWYPKSAFVKSAAVSWRFQGMKRDIQESKCWCLDGMRFKLMDVEGSINPSGNIHLIQIHLIQKRLEKNIET